MAITKILTIDSSGSGTSTKHLARGIDYVLNPLKTQDGRLTGAVNCQTDIALQQFRETKKHFNKTDKRQGYHIVISFKGHEATPDTAFEITRRFAEEYLGQNYEAVYSVHDNTENIHGHIIFNSVKFTDGRKYRYEKGDWAKHIQPITNRLCEEHGLSTIDIEKSQKTKDEKIARPESSKRFGGKATNWSEMIRLDVDACIMLAPTYNKFIELLTEKGYEVKNAHGEGKHIKIRPPGKDRFWRLPTLGKDYTADRIKERLAEESLASYSSLHPPGDDAKIIPAFVKRYPRAPLSGIQKKYYEKLYRTGQLKKRAFSQAYKYKEEIQKMHQLEKQYLFLVKHDIHNEADLNTTIGTLYNKKKQANTEKSRVYREAKKHQSLFAIVHEMNALIPAKIEYEKGDDFFRLEYEKWHELNAKLESAGHSFSDLTELNKTYKNRKAETSKVERELYNEIKIGKTILVDLSSGASAKANERDNPKTKVLSPKDEKKVNNTGNTERFK